MQNNVRQLARLGLMVAVLEVSKLALAAIPNIELVSFWVILFTLWIGWRSLYAIYGFVLLEGILYGVHFWWIAYLYVWTILAALTQLLHKQTGAALLGHVIRLVWFIFRRAVRNPLCSGGYIKRRIVEWFSGRLFLVDCRHPLRFAALRRQLYHHADTV